MLLDRDIWNENITDLCSHGNYKLGRLSGNDGPSVLVFTAMNTVWELNGSKIYK